MAENVYRMEIAVFPLIQGINYFLLAANSGIFITSCNPARKIQWKNTPLPILAPFWELLLGLTPWRHLHEYMNVLINLSVHLAFINSNNSL